MMFSCGNDISVHMVVAIKIHYGSCMLPMMRVFNYLADTGAPKVLT